MSGTIFGSETCDRPILFVCALPRGHYGPCLPTLRYTLHLSNSTKAPT